MCALEVFPAAQGETASKTDAEPVPDASVECIVGSLSWGDRLLDRSFPRPRCGELTLFLQSGRELEPLLLRVAAAELAADRPLHWIDGGGRIDPGRLTPLLHWRGADVRAALARMQVCRGFTAHQLQAQVARLAAVGEGTPEELRLVIVDRLAAMFADPQVAGGEGRALLRSSLEALTTLARERSMCVLVSVATRASPPLPREHEQMLLRHADATLRSRPVHGRTASGVRLLHQPSAETLRWRPLPWNQASLLDFTSKAEKAVSVNGERDARSIPDSSQPNGESTAQMERTASGS